MTVRKKHPQKFKDDAVAIVLSSDKTIVQVAAQLGVNEGTLGNWVRKYRIEHPEEFPVKDDEPVDWATHQKLLAENARLRQENEFLGKVSAFFAAKQR